MQRGQDQAGGEEEEEGPEGEVDPAAVPEKGAADPLVRATRRRMAAALY